MTDTRPSTPQPAQPLPPYSGEETLCAKCSYPEAYTIYRRASFHPVAEDYNGPTYRGPLPERLERCCQRCDYKWDEALAPAPAAAPASATDVALALTEAAPRALDLTSEAAEAAARALLDMLHVQRRPDHPVWRRDPGSMPAVPRDIQEPAVVKPVPLSEKPSSSFRHRR